MESASRKQTEIVVPFKRAQERRGDELAFLPAALEIVETPPSPVGRLTVPRPVYLGYSCCTSTLLTAGRIAADTLYCSA